MDYEEIQRENLLDYLRGRDEKGIIKHGLYCPMVYIKESCTALGVFWNLRNLGYYSNDIAIQPWHVPEYVSMNPYISITDNGNIYFSSLGNIDDYSTSEEIAIEMEKTQKRRSEYSKKPVINCGENYRLFNALAMMRDDDDTTAFYIYMRNGQKTIDVGDCRWHNFETDADEWYRQNMRKATLEEVIDYFTNPNSELSGTRTKYGTSRKRELSEDYS